MTNRAQTQPKVFMSKPKTNHSFTPISQCTKVAVYYLFALGIAEFLVAMGAAQFGMLLHSLIVIALLLHESQSKQPLQRNFLLCLILAPLIRLLSLMMPLKLFPIIYWYLITAVPLLVTAYLIARHIGLTRQMTGLVISAPWLQLLVSLSGLILGYMEYVILRPTPLISELRWELIWLPALILLIFTGFLEELIFRGLLQSTTLSHLGRNAIFYVAAVFTVLHLGYRSVLDLLFVFGVALFFGYIVKWSGSILGVSIAHGLINIGIYLIFPLLLAIPATTQDSVTSVIPEATATYMPEVSSILPPLYTQEVPIVLPTSSTTYSMPSPSIMPTKLFTASPAAITKTPQPTSTDWVDCSEAIPTRLEVGMKAQVISLVYLRIEPGPSKLILDTLVTGNRLEIIGGPACIPYIEGAYRWWQVKLDDGRIGWSAEGLLKGTDYFLAPYP